MRKKTEKNLKRLNDERSQHESKSQAAAAAALLCTLVPGFLSRGNFVGSLFEMKEEEKIASSLNYKIHYKCVFKAKIIGTNASS